MSKLRIKWDRKEFEAIRRSPGVQNRVTQECERLAKRFNAASPSNARYGYSTMQGKTRFRGIVFTENFKARVDNAKRNTMLNGL